MHGASTTLTLGHTSRLELTPVSHRILLLGTIMMGRETEAHLLQVREMKALHIWLLTRMPIHLQTETVVAITSSILMTKPHLTTLETR
jgi:hypothetical protein